MTFSDHVGGLISTLARHVARVVPRGSTAWRLLAGARSWLPRSAPRGKIARLLGEFARSYPDAKFVQVGSNDGYHRDPLRRHIVGRHWTGILVEPVPYVFRRLQERYRDAQQVRLENAAIAAEDGVCPFYFLRETDEATNALPEWYDNLGSFTKEVVLSHRIAIPNIEELVVCEQVPCMTFESLCRKHGLDHVDLVHLDAEGYDFEIIKTLDLDRLQPRLLLYECKHLGEAHSQCRAHLRARGFELLEEGDNVLALRVCGLTSKDRELLRAWHAMAREVGRPTGRVQE